MILKLAKLYLSLIESLNPLFYRELNESQEELISIKISYEKYLQIIFGSNLLHSTNCITLCPGGGRTNEQMAK